MQLAERLLHPTTFSFPWQGESENSDKEQILHRPEVWTQSYYEKKGGFKFQTKAKTDPKDEALK